MGLMKNLAAGEIVRQRLVAMKLREERIGASPGAGKRGKGSRYFADGIQNIVFMGMGEPLDNFDHVVQAIRVFTEPMGMNFPHTQITVSTVGRIDGLRKLAALKWINLRVAISLNAAVDRLRDELMPVNKGMPLAELKRALQEYPLAPRGRFLIEYVLIKGVNDSAGDAQAVAEFCAGLACIVNVIPYNPQRFASFETPAEETILAFMRGLKDRGIFVKRRVTHGRGMMGACGQLGNPEVRRKSSPVALNVAAGR
jgi:23S rRNA (adenine2503-C2)-methyltransferase